MGGMGGELGKGGTDGGGREGGGRKGGGCDGGGVIGGAGGAAGGGSGEGGDLGALPGANGGRHGVGGYGGRGGGEKSSTLCIAGPNTRRSTRTARQHGVFKFAQWAGQRNDRFATPDRAVGDDSLEGRPTKVFVHALHPTRARERTTVGGAVLPAHAVAPAVRKRVRSYGLLNEQTVRRAAARR